MLSKASAWRAIDVRSMTTPVEEGSPRSSAADVADIARALEGDAEGYRRLVERYQVTIGRQMRRFSRVPAIYEELTHEVFVQAWQCLPRYRGDSSWLHWLRKIAVRVGYRHWKETMRPGKQLALADDEWHMLRAPHPESIGASEAAELIHRVLARLRPADRLILTLVHLDGLSMREAAEHTGWSIPTTKVRAFRARRRLRKLIEGGSP